MKKANKKPMAAKKKIVLDAQGFAPGQQALMLANVATNEKRIKDSAAGDKEYRKGFTKRINNLTGTYGGAIAATYNATKK